MAQIFLLDLQRRANSKFPLMWALILATMMLCFKKSSGFRVACLGYTSSVFSIEVAQLLRLQEDESVSFQLQMLLRVADSAKQTKELKLFKKLAGEEFTTLLRSDVVSLPDVPTTEAENIWRQVLEANPGGLDVLVFPEPDDGAMKTLLRVLASTPGSRLRRIITRKAPEPEPSWMGALTDLSQSGALAEPLRIDLVGHRSDANMRDKMLTLALKQCADRKDHPRPLPVPLTLFLREDENESKSPVPPTPRDRLSLSEDTIIINPGPPAISFISSIQRPC